MIRHCIVADVGRAMPDAEVVHLRAKHLEAGELLERARWWRRNWNGLLVINERVDVCLACGADGVHLPGGRIAPRQWKERLGARLMVGVSCHSVSEVIQAEQQGADYVYLSPVFESPSKPGYGPVLGAGVLAEASARVKIPVLALGGMNAERWRECAGTGAAGFAAISAFA
jgi:thiamine-phosphate pyrophosphorylase